MAEKQIEIHAPGKVFGNVESPMVVIAAGAVFQGKCRTRAPKVVEKDVLKTKITGDQPATKQNGSGP